LIKSKNKTTLGNLIKRSCEIKSEIVNQDEMEHGIRAILNLGHTFGHSIEKLGNYTTYHHGEAVAMGITAASILGVMTGTVTEDESERIVTLCKRLRIYQRFPDYPPNIVYDGMLNDKKIKAGKLNLILPKGIGSYMIIDDINKAKIMEAIKTAQDLIG